MKTVYGLYKYYKSHKSTDTYEGYQSVIKFNHTDRAFSEFMIYNLWLQPKWFDIVKKCHNQEYYMLEELKNVTAFYEVVR